MRPSVLPSRADGPASGGARITCAGRSLEVDGVPTTERAETARGLGVVLRGEVHVVTADVARLHSVEIAVRTVRIVGIGARIAARATGLILLGPHLIEAALDPVR